MHQNRDKDGFVLDDKNKRILPSEDLTGKKYERLTVIGYSHTDNNGRHWLCECDCSGEKRVTPTAGALNSGNTKSCGCISREMTAQRNRDGIIYDTPLKIELSQRLRHIKERCYKKYHKSYHMYGGRGVAVCDEWLDKDNGFDNFYSWSIENGYQKDLTIDRINNDGNYEPDNCRWVDMVTQANNRRDNVIIEYEGQSHSIAEWARIKGLERKTLEWRFREGWTGDELFQPSRTKISLDMWGK